MEGRRAAIALPALCFGPNRPEVDGKHIPKIYTKTKMAVLLNRYFYILYKTIYYPNSVFLFYWLGQLNKVIFESFDSALIRYVHLFCI